MVSRAAWPERSLGWSAASIDTRIASRVSPMVVDIPMGQSTGPEWALPLFATVSSTVATSSNKIVFVVPVTRRQWSEYKFGPDF